MSEVEFLAKFYGRYLGGIDYERALEVIRKADSPLLEQFGIADENSDEDKLKSLECSRAKALAHLYRSIERSLVEAIKDAKLNGVSDSSMKNVISRLRKVRRRLKMYRQLIRWSCT